MNVNVERLYQIALKSHRKIIGLMSGTSLDGLDIAYCTIYYYGRDTKVILEAFDTIPYNDDVKEKIRKVFAKKEVDFPYLAQLNEWIGSLHGNMVKEFLDRHNIAKDEVDIVASHGQTVMHVPKHQHVVSDFTHATLQIGDGDQISSITGIISISDFRQKHIAAGGEGAPLAVYGDYLMFSEKGSSRIMLNIGGISNFTYLPADGIAASVFVTDTGPGNTLMDAWTKKYCGHAYDQNGLLASRGIINVEMLNGLKKHEFFKLDFPKTTGPELFNLTYAEEIIRSSKLANISNEDVLATLNRFTAETIVDAINAITGEESSHVYLSGGGVHNQLLVKTLKELLPHCFFSNCDELGIGGDAKEAVLFAVLANETLVGEPIDFGKKQGVPSVFMGKISFPT